MEVDPPPPPGSGGEPTKPGSSVTASPKRDDQSTSGASGQSKRAGDAVSAAVVAGPSSASPSNPSRNSNAAKANKVKQRAEEQRRVMLALYPTPEAKAAFKEKVGVDVDPARLLDSVRFRDAWQRFSATNNPGTGLKGELKTMAARIMGKTRRPEPPRSADDGKGKTPVNKDKSSKRSREISASPASVSLGKPYKIPKHSASAGPQSGQPQASTSKAATADPNASDDEVVTGEYPNLADFEGDGEDQTYARAASRKQIVEESPLTLYIHMSLEDKLRMPRNVWEVFNEKLQEKCLECLARNDTPPPPRAEFTGFKAGIGAIVPADEESRDTIKTLVSSIEVAGKRFRAWQKDEKADWTLLTCQIPSSMKPSVYTQGMLITSIITLNSFQPEEGQDVAVKGLSCKAAPNNPNRRLLRFLVRNKTLCEMHGMGGRVYVGVNKLEVFLAGKPLKDYNIQDLVRQPDAPSSQP
jgi:hypothetical protein